MVVSRTRFFYVQDVLYAAGTWPESLHTISGISHTHVGQCAGAVFPTKNIQLKIVRFLNIHYCKCK